MAELDFNHVEAKFPGGRTKTYDQPLSLSQLADEPEMEAKESTGPLLAVRVNGRVLSLMTKLDLRHAAVDPVFLNSTEGRSIYRRSLVFVVTLAAHQEFGKDWLVIVEHSFNGGYLCTVNRGQQVSDEEVQRLRRRVDALVAEDLPIDERRLSWADARDYFREANRPFSLAYVESANTDAVYVNACAGFASLRHRALVRSTAALRGKFSVLRVDGGRGFAICFPGTEMLLSPRSEVVEDPTMAAVYRQYNEWGRRLGVECVGDLNRRIAADESKTFVAMSETLHNHKIVDIGQDVQKRLDTLRMVLIAGPSASGKTTFAGKLSIQLQILGLTPVILSVDNYYKPRSEMPRDDNGDIDFEAIEALRVDTFNEHLTRLLKGETIESPIFDFHLGVPKRETIRVSLPPNGILVMEGIHMLNDKMTPSVPKEAKYRIFVAPLSQLNLDECNFSSHSVTRQLRRINRDFNHRGYSAADTLARWPSVARGEEKYILPFMKSADRVFNTALDYETAALKTYVAPLLRTIKPSSELYNTACNLLDVLDMFFPIPHDNVPPNSLLREFIGGSFFES